MLQNKNAKRLVFGNDADFGSNVLKGGNDFIQGRTSYLKPKFNGYRKNALGYPEQKGFYKDSDKDYFPNFMDCQPYNPRKQGFLGDVAGAVKEAVVSRVTESKHDKGERQQKEYYQDRYGERKSLVGRAVTKYHEYKAKEPERLKAKTAIMEEKHKQSKIEQEEKEYSHKSRMNRIAERNARISATKRGSATFSKGKGIQRPRLLKKENVQIQSPYANFYQAPKERPRLIM
jgi:hypothetical protein